MLKKIKTNFIKITALTLLTTFGLTGVVAAQAGTNIVQDSVCKGGDSLQLPTGGGTDTTSCTSLEQGSTSKLNTLITQIINIFSVIVGIIAVIFIIIGGLKYITSGGDSGNVTGAKNTILYAIIGLIIVALAQFIVRFVLAKTAQTAA